MRRAISMMAAVATVCAGCLAQRTSAWSAAVESAAGLAPDARVVVLDVKTGRLLAGHRINEAARTLAAPGSTLKPIVLYGLVAAGRWDPQRRVSCDRRLVVAGHRLACTHPAAPPFDAREALTWSCNSYFAAVARTLGPGELGHLLRPSGLLSTTGLEMANTSAQEEAVAEFHEPKNSDAMQLAMLGVEGIRVTPLELAVAYRWLAIQLNTYRASRAAGVVQTGLHDSAEFGMAGEANLGGVAVAGKTGTAETTATGQTHGWFAGMAPADNPQVVLAVYMPSGRGADAAHFAGELLARSSLGRR